MGEPERYELQVGNGLEAVSKLAPATVDAIITDPPYCSGGFLESERMSARVTGVRSELEREWFSGDRMGTAGLGWLLHELGFFASVCLKPSGSLLVFANWRMLGTIAPAVESAGLRYQNLVVWDKRSAGLGMGFRARHELVLHFTAERPEFHDRATGNVITCPRAPRAEVEDHPAAKPVELLRALIRVVAPVGGLVVDPLMGAGATGVAALREGCRFLGIERTALFVEIARRRIESEAREGTFELTPTRRSSGREPAAEPETPALLAPADQPNEIGGEPAFVRRSRPRV